MPTSASEAISLSPQARWIWAANTKQAYNNIVCFRREFEISSSEPLCHGKSIPSELLITADSRYEVYVNGTWLGHGPARSWQSPWPMDPYDLRASLQPGRNVIAVLVQHFGIGTFQYINAEPGLLSQLTWSDSAGRHTLVSDGSWRACSHAGYLWPVPRIGCQQAWEEQYDSRRFPSDWMQRTPSLETRTSISSWPAATITRKPGEGEHAKLVRRDIPQLTRIPVDPVRIRSVEAVRPAPYSWNLNPRAFLNPHDNSANVPRGNMLLLTHIYSARSQTIQLHQPHNRPFLPWTLNGRELSFDDHSLQRTDTGVAHARLKSGWNSLMCTLPPHDHHWWAVINAWTPHAIIWSATPSSKQSKDSGTQATPWLALGPFGNPNQPLPLHDSEQHPIDAFTLPDEASLEQFEKIRIRGSLSPREYSSAYVHPLTPDMVATEDVYAQCSSERVDDKTQPRVENPAALQHDTAEWTLIHPLPATAGQESASVRLLLDFGRELIGFHEFEIDAPADTIIDNHNFEFIQPDGRYNLAEGMNNAFRYVCREGVQHYRTILRRGFQYSWFSIRNFKRPVRIRHIRVLFSTYPQTQQGAFACSDAWLDRIWEAGAHSVRCCSEDTYTDCPSYEQTFWVGDARNEALVDFVVNGDPRLSQHAWRLAAQSLERSPIVESQVPSGWENILPAWSFLWMRWAQEHHQHTGDHAFAQEMLQAIDLNVDGIEKNLSPRGLFQMRAWNLFDWAPLDTPAGGEVTHVNCLAVLGLRQCTTLAQSVGREASAYARRWSQLADRLTKAINTHLWDQKRKAYVDSIHADGTKSTVFSQQTHTAAYMANIPTPARRKRTREIMYHAPTGFVKAGSPFFMFFVLEGLAREQRFPEMLRTIREYWGKQMEVGANTTWEIYHEDAPRMTRSHCHGWSAAPTYFLSNFILGVQPATPGYTKVRIAPRPCGLHWARGRVPTPQGVVEISWQLTASKNRQKKASKKQQFEIRATLPPEISAEIELPPEVDARCPIKILRGKVSQKTKPHCLLTTGGGLIHLVAG